MDPVPFTGQPTTFTPTGKAPSQPFGQVKDDNFSYRLAGQYKLNPDAMVYVSYATGYKPGGAAFVGNNYSPYKAETVKSSEIGIKTELFDRRVRLNADVFRSEFTDFQTSLLTFVPGNPVAVIATGNAGGLKSQGFETTFAWRAAEGLTLSGGVTYADAKFTDFVYNATTNYGGTRLTNAPKWQGSFSANYEREIGAYRLRANLDYAHRTRTWSAVGQAANTEMPGYGIANGRLSVSPENGGVEVGLYGRNLLDKYFSTAFEQYSTMSLTHRISRDAHRTVGVFAKYAF
jgi:iron complex outermembrane receptor protein